MIQDLFGRTHSYLRISITPACNLSCLYCMPAGGFPVPNRKNLMSVHEIGTMAKWFSRLGVNKIRLTGGEPTIRRDLPEIISTIRNESSIRDIGLTTNGTRVSEELSSWVDAGLKAINISLDTLKKDRFLKLNGTNQFDSVLMGIHQAIVHPGIQVKVNTVVLREINHDEPVSMIRHFLDYPIELRFIELMPFSGNQWSPEKFVSGSEIRQQIEENYVLEPVEAEIGQVATSFKLAGYPLKIGFISSISDAFCGSCNRIRLTSEGTLKSCLFDDGELNLLKPLRNGCSFEDFTELVNEKIRMKPASHGGHDFRFKTTKRTMVSIGG